MAKGTGNIFAEKLVPVVPLNNKTIGRATHINKFFAALKMLRDIQADKNYRLSINTNITARVCGNLDTIRAYTKSEMAVDEALTAAYAMGKKFDDLKLVISSVLAGIAERSSARSREKDVIFAAQVFQNKDVVSAMQSRIMEGEGLALLLVKSAKNNGMKHCSRTCKSLVRQIIEKSRFHDEVDRTKRHEYIRTRLLGKNFPY